MLPLTTIMHRIQYFWWRNFQSLGLWNLEKVELLCQPVTHLLQPAKVDLLLPPDVSLSKTAVNKIRASLQQGLSIMLGGGASPYFDHRWTGENIA